MRSITGKPARGEEYSRDEGCFLLQRSAFAEYKMSLKTWIKKLGFWGFLFFLLKGLLWLAITALIAIFVD